MCGDDDDDDDDYILFFGGGGLDWHRISFFSFSLIRKSVRSRTCEKK